MIDFEILNEHQQALGKAVAASAPPDADRIVIDVTGETNKPRIAIQPPMGLDEDVLLAIRKLLLLYKDDGNELSRLLAVFVRDSGGWDMSLEYEYVD